MRSNFFLSFIRVLKLPLKLLVGLFGRKLKNKKSDLERKQLTYVKNFSPKHYSWQKSLGKDKKPTKKNKVGLKGKERQKSTKK